jgi:hypothetical protein
LQPHVGRAFSTTGKCAFDFTYLRLMMMQFWIMQLLQPQDGCRLSPLANKTPRLRLHLSQTDHDTGLDHTAVAATS